MSDYKKYKTKGQLAYELRKSGTSWKDVKEAYGSSALDIAKYYANTNRLEWPIKLKGSEG